MTKAHSEADDNNGRCEGCDAVETFDQEQRTYPTVIFGGAGTLWLCLTCLATRRPAVVINQLVRRSGRIIDVFNKTVPVPEPAPI